MADNSSQAEATSPKDVVSRPSDTSQHLSSGDNRPPKLLDQVISGAKSAGNPKQAKLNQKPGVKPSGFKIFDAFLCHDDLLLYLATQHLEPQEFFILYSVSRPFHYLVNLNITSYILSSARRWARLTPTRPCFSAERPHHTQIPGVAGNPSVNRQIFLAATTASRRLMEMCGTDPTPAGTYSDHDITTILPFRCYGHLCSTDPAQRDFSAEVSHVSKTVAPTSLTNPPLDDTSQPATSDSTEASSSVPAPDPPLPRKPVIRDVPTFRYLKFLLDRARTIQLIIHHMAGYGHRLPPRETPAILARISLTLDIPKNLRRAALFRNTKYWTNKDLFVANLFFIKLDMCFTDPVDGKGETTMRKLLLSQRSLVPLEQTLARTQCTSLFETLKLYVRTLHIPSAANRGYDIFGIPAAEVGMIGTEGWGLPANQFDPRRGQRNPVTESQGRPQQHDQSQGQGQAQGQDLPEAHSEAQQQQQQQQTHPPAGAAAAAAAAQPSPAPPQRPRLLRPDQLLALESVRRRLPLHHHYLRMMSYGYLDPLTLNDLPDPGGPVEQETQDSSVPGTQSEARPAVDSARLEELRRLFSQGVLTQPGLMGPGGLQYMYTVDSTARCGGSGGEGGGGGDDSAGEPMDTT